MTTNQMIDGVKVLSAALALVRSNEASVKEAAILELRALLDAPAEPKPTGLSQGWNLTRKHDGFVIGHQSAVYPPDAKAIERAERDGYVWVPFLVPAAQPQGEPVAVDAGLPNDDIPDFTPGNGNKARRRAESLGLNIPPAPSAYDSFDNGVD